MDITTFDKYVNRSTREKVTAMKYNNIHDFDKLFQLIGDVYPTITKAHTRVYEGNWVIRHSDNHIEFMCCAHGEKCFENAYEIYK